MAIRLKQIDFKLREPISHSSLSDFKPSFQQNELIWNSKLIPASRRRTPFTVAANFSTSSGGLY
jgi:hypothetical protein